MIEFRVRHVGRSWRATAVVDGRTFSVSALNAPTNKLARLLKARGIPDQPIRLLNPTGTEFFEGQTLYGWASFDFQKLKANQTEGAKGDERSINLPTRFKRATAE